MSDCKHHQVIIIGAGAAGLMCALTAGYRGRDVLLLDNAKQLGRKILISGGGRCNFTNLQTQAAAYLCTNPHFVKSALARFTQWDFIAMVERHGIAYHEKTLGQLFCDESAKEIVEMLTTECDWAGVKIQLRTEVLNVSKKETGFELHTSEGNYSCESLVIATGGLSMPKLGATPFGFKLAQQFGLRVLPTTAGLVPFTLQPEDKSHFECLAGVSLPVTVTSASGQSFSEALLFTHRGISGPAILQISSYWKPGEAVYIDLLPGLNFVDWYKTISVESPKLSIKNALSRLLPKRLVERLQEIGAIPDKALNQLSKAEVEAMADYFANWSIAPGGTEGYRTAEVTLGGVCTDELSSKTLEAKACKGLYFIGEVVDVTGWLGGYNFQWAWSSGHAAGEAV
ncbi:NAD(P)/FAD-dependent oxidoreductase [Shewanella sp. FJAT-52076]|uniref:NAD(P)/FAD-dependent oxidoreductase n=1 Tax=Shewanella sp. FJAT-52076 TaxID=2864202 RepID=UPI001C65D953|nr:NAD(P)/FAD-dependent oxidoreductase [Shewanella sp. FJAT-52076]QYJ75486.1 NAD(P)/FAD-dependent oxidoreductase [Shewanella sp. FJAT-52076]